MLVVFVNNRAYGFTRAARADAFARSHNAVAYYIYPASQTINETIGDKVK